MAAWEWANRFHVYESSANLTNLNPELRAKYQKQADDLKQEFILCMQTLLGENSHNFNLMLEHFDAVLTYKRDGEI